MSWPECLLWSVMIISVASVLITLIKEYYREGYRIPE